MSETETPPLQRPADILLNFIVTLLTPMFLSAAEGNLAFAQQAAAATLADYRAQTQSDLITVAKIIAFGLAALSSLTLSMAEDLPVATILRLRASANASDRSEHRNRLALKHAAANRPVAAPEPDIDYAALNATVAETQKRTAQNLASLQPSVAIPSTADKESHYQATWAACTAAIAAETAASLPSLAPTERMSAAIWVEVLNEAANSFLTEGIPPRLRPGDLVASMQGG